MKVLWGPRVKLFGGQFGQTTHLGLVVIILVISSASLVYLRRLTHHILFPTEAPHLLSKGFACFVHLRGCSRLKEVSCSASASGCVAKAVTIECSISMTLPSYLMKLFSTLHKISTSRHVLLHLAKLTALCDVQEILRIDLQVILRLNCVLVFIQPYDQAGEINWWQL